MHQLAIRLITCTAVLFLCLGWTGGPSPAAASSASPGCGRTWATGQDITDNLNVAGVSRTTIVHVPASYNSSTPTMLVLNLHPATATALAQEIISGMDGDADAHGYLVVYPNSTIGADDSPVWNAFFPTDPGEATSGVKGADDVGFLNALVPHLEASFCVDPTRIAMTGYSSGGNMTYHMACLGTSWLAAIAPVAAALPQPTSECAFTHPISIIAFHGQVDPVIWYGLAAPLWESIPQEVADISRGMGCQTTPHTGMQLGDVVQSLYAPCQDPNVDVQLYTVTDGGHTWPGGFPVFWFGNTTYVISATRTMAGFFAGHPLQAGRTT